MIEVLNEVGEMWDSLTDIDKSAIATALGGYGIAATYGNIWVLYNIYNTGLCLYRSKARDG